MTRVLTFNVHTQYLYLLSKTGWDIENLVIDPNQGYQLNQENPWHTMPYGYPTFNGSINAGQVTAYGYLFPEDWQAPPPLWMSPPAFNIKNVALPEGDYDMVIYLDYPSIRFYDGPAKKKVYVNLRGNEKVPPFDGALVCHVPIEGYTYFPIGIVDDFMPWEGNHQSILVNFPAYKSRQNDLRSDILDIVAKGLPLHFHDIQLEPWDHWQLRDSISRFQTYLELQARVTGPSLSLLEALTAGIPSVIYDPHKHMPDFEHNIHCMRAHNGQQALYAALRLLRNEDLRKEIGAAGQELAKKRYSIDQFVENWQRIATE